MSPLPRGHQNDVPVDGGRPSARPVYRPPSRAAVRSALPEAQVQYPTPSYVFPSRPAVGHDFVVVTPGIQKGISQDRHVTPPPLVVDGLGQTNDEPVVPGQG